MDEWKWQSRDGLEMFARSWSPEKPKAAVCLVHGHGEHIGRYTHVGEAFTEAGYALHGFDLRGHGQSGGPRGHTPSGESLLTDIHDFLEAVQRRNPGLPVFLYGHSMGGNLVINYALRSPQGLKGMIVSDPWLQLAFEPPAFQLFLAKIMDRILPSFSQADNLEQAALSRDPEVVRRYAQDPLVHDLVSARLFTVIHTNGLWALEHASELKVPTLLMHGSADRLTSAKASERFAASAGEIVTLRIWDGFYHEIHNEPESKEVLKVMTDWLDTHL